MLHFGQQNLSDSSITTPKKKYFFFCKSQDILFISEVIIITGHFMPIIKKTTLFLTFIDIFLVFLFEERLTLVINNVQKQVS